MKSLLVALFFWIVCVSAGNAETDDPVKAGYDAFKRGEWMTAYQTWLPLAKSGDSRAQFYLSVLYTEGLGVQQSPDLALNWLNKAAQGRFAPAQFNLGNLYQKGDWLEYSDEKSAYWWEKAAEQGFDKAQFNLGSLYYLGKGVKQDLNRAFYWYRKAARGGSRKAKETLQRLGVPLTDNTIGVSNDGEVVAAKSVNIQKKVPKKIVKYNNKKNDNVKSKPEENKGQIVQTEQPVPAEDPRLRMDQQWIMQQPNDNYTIQLFATDKLESAKEFLAKLELNVHLALFEFHRFGETWFAVIGGSFNDHYEAKMAIETFPDGAKENDPWVKRFKLIKDTLGPGKVKK